MSKKGRKNTSVMSKRSGKTFIEHIFGGCGWKNEQLSVLNSYQPLKRGGKLIVSLRTGLSARLNPFVSSQIGQPVLISIRNLLKQFNKPIKARYIKF